MGRYAQLVIGPAGCGKSTYCNSLHQHCEAIGRRVHVVNLDPAAEQFEYPSAFDIRDLITLEDVMDELKMGPNGGLLASMEYMEENLDEWLGEELEGFGDEDYLVFDCPGQIELYSHVTVFKTLSEWLIGQGWSICVVYCIDCQFASDVSKFISGSLQALAAMVMLELPHTNVLTKVDLLTSEAKQLLDQFLFPDTSQLAGELQRGTSKGFQRLNRIVSRLLDDWGMVSFTPLDYSDEDSIGYVLSQVISLGGYVKKISGTQIDNAIQFGEDADIKTSDLDSLQREDCPDF